jgi:HAE1 family hydrophobic/amphiphilic exporter-1
MYPKHYIDEEHLSPREATSRAMENISGPVIAIALILAAVFIPVGFVPCILGRLYQQFAITIGIAVLISAFVALSLTPALCSIMLKPSKEEDAKIVKDDSWRQALDSLSAKFTNRELDKKVKVGPSFIEWLLIAGLALLLLKNFLPFKIIKT